MKPWWIFKYFNRKNGYNKFDSSIIPFKLLPELDRINVKKGHKFKTDQFEIRIPGSDIILHMPTGSLWVNNKPHVVENASRVILFNRKYHRSDGETWREIYIGLISEKGQGILIKYCMDTNQHVIKIIDGNIPTNNMAIYDQPKLPGLEKK